MPQLQRYKDMSRYQALPAGRKYFVRDKREPELVASKLRVMILGLRGFPNIQGGIERSIEQLSPLLVELGCEVEAIVRSPYMSAERVGIWRGVRFHRIWSPRNKGIEAIVHTFLGVLYAALRRPDVLHIQAIGPALMTPIARLFGLRVVVTHHGPDYDRQKWGGFAKAVLKLGEGFGMRFAHGRIVISNTIQNLVRNKYGIASCMIPNGVVLPTLPSSTTALRRFDLEPGRYVLMVSRIVPEKRHIDLIQAFSLAMLPGWKLAIVGAADHPDNHFALVQQTVNSTPGVVLTGFQSGLALSELYAHAGVFVLPSAHEGLPLALLEALSYGLPVLASDIPANLELGLSNHNYFRLGDVASLAEHLRRRANSARSQAERDRTSQWVAQRYNWHEIAKKTLEIYQLAMSRSWTRVLRDGDRP